MDINQITLRAARNILIDLLEIGDTYPIRDLKVEAENPKVAYGQIGRIKVHQSQSDVNYALFKLVNNSYEKVEKVDEITGTGETIVIEAGPILTDTVFGIKALKEINDRREELLLHQSAEIQVGMDSKLKTYINGPGLVDYDTSARIIIEKSQEGVAYQLWNENNESLSEPVAGTSIDIEVTTFKLKEDVKIKISATKVFEFEEEVKEGAEPVLDKPSKKKEKKIINEEEKILLDTILSIQVRPHTKGIVTLKNPVIDWHTAAILLLDGTQASVTYELFASEVRDEDYVFNSAETPSNILIISTAESVDEQVRIRIADHQLTSSERVFESIGKFAGKEGKLTIAPETLFTEDTLFIVQATKTGTEVTVQLETTVAVLVKPDTTKEVVVQSSDGSGVNNLAIIKASQPGVKYQLSLGKKLLSDAVYHHKNKGLETARLERDFILDSYDSDSVQLYAYESLKDKSFKVTATKIYSGVTTELSL